MVFIFLTRVRPTYPTNPPPTLTNTPPTPTPLLQAVRALNGSIGVIRMSLRETGNEGRYSVKCCQIGRKVVGIKPDKLTARSHDDRCAICQDPLVVEPVFLERCGLTYTHAYSHS